MKLRVSFIILAILGAVGAVLVFAKYPTSPHTINYDDPWQIFTAIITIIIPALPSLILGYFNNLVCRIISAILQIFGLLMWVFLAIFAFAMGYIPHALMSSLTVILLIVSIVITLTVGYKKTSVYV